jgi:hypothetical protein
MREAAVLIPDPRISYELARCLSVRFQTGSAVNDYEEAIAIADNIVATYSPGDSPTATQRDAIHLIKVLVMSRFHSYSSPEYLLDAIHRIRTLLSFPSLSDEDRAELVEALDNYLRQRSSYFGVTGTGIPGEIPSNPSNGYVTIS